MLYTTTHLRGVGGIQIEIDRAIFDAFIICVTCDHYPAVDFQKRHFLKGESGNPSALAISIFDLDVIGHYLIDPAEFTFYVRQRSHTTDNFLAEEEIQYLGYHLKIGLSKLRDTDLAMIANDFADDINRDFTATRVPDIQIDRADPRGARNVEFDKLIELVRTKNGPGYLDALFFLFQFTKSSADELIEQILRVKKRAQVDGRSHDIRLQYQGEDAGVTYICSSRSVWPLEERVHLLGLLGKYKSRSDKWLAMGAHSDSRACPKFS